MHDWSGKIVIFMRDEGKFELSRPVYSIWLPEIQTASLSQFQFRVIT